MSIAAPVPRAWSSNLLFLIAAIGTEAGIANVWKFSYLAGVNGGGGALLNDNPSVDTVRTIATAHRRFGTVGMLPTVITDAPQVIAKAVVSVARAMAEGVPGVLGIHIEGPFLDVARKGAHAARFIRDMEEADVDAIAGFAMYCPVMLTLAPNRVAPALVRRLMQAGVLVSLGHSEASFAEARQALDAGARSITHLYNAMSQMTGREPGLVGAALTDAESYVGIIADGHHVHDAAMRVALPEANPALSLTLSLGVTFPFNITIGLPLYLWLASVIAG